MMGSVELLIAGLMLLGPLGGGIPLPAANPPLPEDAVLLGIAPEKCLVFLHSAGVGKPDASSTNRTEQILAESDVQEFHRRVLATLQSTLTLHVEMHDADVRAFATHAGQLLQAMGTRPWSLYIGSLKVQDSPARYEPRAGFALHCGEETLARRENMLALEKLLAKRAGLREQAGTEVAADEATSATAWRTLPLPAPLPAIRWSVRGKYLLIATGEEEHSELLARARSRIEPTWLKSLQAKLPVPRPAAIAYINVRGILEALSPLAAAHPRSKFVLEELGRLNLTTITQVSGLDETGLTSRTLLAFDGAPGGLLKPFEKPLAKSDLSMIPADARLVVAGKIDPDRCYKVLEQWLEQLPPDDAARLRKRIERIENEGQRIRLKDDLFEALGDTWRIYHSPSHGGGALAGAVAVIDLRDGNSVGGVMERLAILFMRAARSNFDRAVKEAVQANRNQSPPPADNIAAEKEPDNNTKKDAEEGPENRGNDPGKAPQISPVTREIEGSREEEEALRDLDYGYDDIEDLGVQRSQDRITRRFKEYKKKRIQYINAARLPMGIAPAWCETDNHLIVAAYPQAIMSFLSRRDDDPSFADTPAAAELFQPDAPQSFFYADPQSQLDMYSMLQELAVCLCGKLQQQGFNFRMSMLPPASTFARQLKPSTMRTAWTADGLSITASTVMPGPSIGVGSLATAATYAAPFLSWTEASNSRQKIENFDVLTEGIFRDIDPSDRLLAPAIVGPDKKPLLSWRVKILPHIGQADLFKRFKLDEAWDSPHNRELIKLMPSVFAAPGSKVAAEGKTRYVLPIGKDALFEDLVTQRALRNLPNSTEKKLFMFEVPDELAVPWTKPEDWEIDLDKLPALFANEHPLNVVTFNGKVKTIPKWIKPEAFKALLTPSSKAWVKGFHIVDDHATQMVNVAGIAMTNYEDASGRLPSPAVLDKDNKPLLSWRVKILPFIEGRKLYDKFNFKEPWDSPHNRELIKLIPGPYATPGSALAKEGKTRMVLVTGKDSVFNGSTGARSKEISDGQNQTIAMVELPEDMAVIWTKPDDWEFDPEKLPALFKQPGGMNISFFSGRTRKYETLTPEMFKAMLTPRGGEKIPPEFVEEWTID